MCPGNPETSLSPAFRGFFAGPSEFLLQCQISLESAASIGVFFPTLLLEKQLSRLEHHFRSGRRIARPHFGTSPFHVPFALLSQSFRGFSRWNSDFVGAIPRKNAIRHAYHEHQHSPRPYILPTFCDAGCSFRRPFRTALT